VATLGLSDAIHGATGSAATGSGASPDVTFARGALVAASIAPGLAPLVGARVGLGRQFEGGLAFTGRAVRADVRRSFDLSAHWAVSLGAGGSAAFDGRQSNTALPGVDLDGLQGWGADVPVLLGYSSEGELYALWLGVRGGWEEVDVRAPVALSATRFSTGGLLGLAIGFRHLHVAAEIESAYATISGAYGGTHAAASGATLAPAACVWWEF
jgi:hypothetical protein